MIYLELVPTEIDTLSEECKWATTHFKDIHGINIPDILRVKNRSYNAAIEISKLNINTIPHIRACDFSANQLISLCTLLQNNDIKNILVISGDPPPNPLQPIYKHNIVNIFKILSEEFPNLNFYGGHDPYRQNMKEEFEYSEQKINAGAKGLFTQPTFDLNLANILLNCKPNWEWYIGISPVLTEKSFNYWKTRNNVIFQSDFECSMSYNIKIGSELIKLCKERNQNNYIMPIKTDLKSYLGELLNG